MKRKDYDKLCHYEEAKNCGNCANKKHRWMSVVVDCGEMLMEGVDDIEVSESYVCTAWRSKK